MSCIMVPSTSSLLVDQKSKHVSFCITCSAHSEVSCCCATPCRCERERRGEQLFVECCKIGNDSQKEDEKIPCLWKSRKKSRHN